MSYLSLYRKWRPQTFEEVVGQRHISQTLANALAQNRVSHAYLFTGPRGTGKTSTAKILAKALNCLDGPTPKPCNQCSICQGIAKGQSIDVLEIDAASNRGIDEIRDLREKVRFSPTECRKKVYIIDEVHMLTTEAFNALLKILEEPPSHVIFVLATTEPRKVPTTIVSRCQRFDFKRIPVAEIVEHLKSVAQAENIRIEDLGLPLIAKQAQGSLRDALGTLEQLSAYCGGEIKLADITAILGMVESELLFELVDIIGEKDISAALLFVENLVESGRDIPQFIRDLLEHLRNLVIVQNVSSPAEIIDTTPEILARLEAQANHFQPFELARFIEILDSAQNKLRWNAQSRLILEMALLEMVRAEVDVSLSGLLYRIEELEKNVGSQKKEVGSRMSDVGSQKSEEVVAELALPQQPAASSQQPGARIDLERVKRVWPVVLEQVKKKRIPTYALLLECQPYQVADRLVTLKFNQEANFHKTEVEKPANLKLVQETLKEVLGTEISLACHLEEAPADSQKSENLPPEEKESQPLARMVQDNFGAEIVEEIKLKETEEK